MNYSDRKLTKSAAKKDRSCKICSSQWLAGADIYILSNPKDDTYELICITCGDQIKSSGELITAKVEDPQTTIINLLKLILEELRKHNKEESRDI